jgi:hypothetical protein
VFQAEATDPKWLFPRVKSHLARCRKDRTNSKTALAWAFARPEIGICGSKAARNSEPGQLVLRSLDWKRRML